MSNNAEKLGEKIKEIRKSLGLNQSEFAYKTNSTVSAVSNWENGRNMPNSERLKRIAFLGNISIYELLNGVESNKQGQIELKKALMNLHDEIVVNNNENNFKQIMSFYQVVDKFNALFPNNKINID